MNNNDKQASVPFSPQESVTELEEQALEDVTGGGIKDLFNDCFACGVPKTSSPVISVENRVTETLPPITSFDNRWTETSQPATYSEYANKKSQKAPTLHPRSFSIDVTKESELPSIRTQR